MGKVLLLTVGTGNVDDIENSLLRPLRLSIARGEWARVVLLPSTVTQAFAERIEHDPARLVLLPLPAAEQENDADACFAHFEAVIEAIRCEGFIPDDILVDFTRGTKAMSAALVLAAVAHGLPRLRYIGGSRDNRGMVVAGTENLRETGPAAALAARRVDLGRELVERGAFAAALDVLPDPDHPFAALHPRLPPESVRSMRSLARFLAAWDRLDYSVAVTVERAAFDALPAAWRPLCPTDAMRGWVTRLAEQPERADRSAMARWLRALVIDLLANAERRVLQQQYEDALVRTYRVLELIGQVRLFDRGIDSESVPEDHPDVSALRQRLLKNKSGDFGRNHRGGLTAPRELAARLLKQMGDPLGGRLLELAVSRRALQPRLRNTSVLVHGFSTQAPSDSADWRDLFEEIWGLLEADHGDAAAFEAERRVATRP